MVSEDLAMGSGCFFIGISGGSGSGKTVLSRALADALGRHRTAIIETDAYYRDLSGIAPELRPRTNFDHPDAIESDLLVAHLKQISMGKAIDKPVYDFTTHTRSRQTLPVQPRPFVLIEGVMVLALDRVAACLDVAIFLDIPADIRFIRRLQRDRSDRGRSVSMIIEQYLTQVRPMHEAFVAPCRQRADLVFTEAPEIRKLARTLEAARDRAYRQSNGESGNFNQDK